MCTCAQLRGNLSWSLVVTFGFREVIGADHCPVRVKVASLLGDGILTFLSS